MRFLKSSGDLLVVTGEQSNQIVRISATNSDVKEASLQVNKESVALQQGEEALLTASVYPSFINKQEIIWYSNQPNVASVTANGQVVAQQAGTAMITATVAGTTIQKTVQVTVLADDINEAAVPQRNGKSHLTVL